VGTNIMSERFTETLRAASEPGWSHAVGHRFVKELFTGAVPDAVMARYLIQDYRFLDSFLTLLGAALASADRDDQDLNPRDSRWSSLFQPTNVPPNRYRTRETTPIGDHASSTRSLTFAARMTATACFAAYSRL
jgi:hypothetical protein